MRIMTLTEQVNNTNDNDERHKIISEERARRVSEYTLSEFYIAIPVNAVWIAGYWTVCYSVLRLNKLFQHALSSHSSPPHDFIIIGEEEAEDFVYMMNMARINRVDRL